MDLIGEWDVVIKTPIGSLQILYTFTDDSGALTGTATGKGETVPCTTSALQHNGLRGASR